MMKRLFPCLILLGALLALFAACNKNYRQDLSPYELADYVERGLDANLFRALDDNAGFYGDLMDPEGDVSFALRVSEDGSNLDEFGVFAAKDEASAKTLSKNLKTYLEGLYRENCEWYLSYIPEEVPKLKDAEVKTFGRYVAYAILRENERNRVFDLLRERLLQVKA